MDTLKLKEMLAKYGMYIGLGLALIVGLVGWKKRAKLKASASRLRKKVRQSKMYNRVKSYSMRRR